MLYVLLFVGWGSLAPTFLGEYRSLDKCEAAKVIVASKYISSWKDGEQVFKHQLVCLPS